MARFLKTLAVACLLVAASEARAAVTSYQPDPANLDNLEHHTLYTWQINNVDPSGQPITGATITIKDIANWDSSPNILYMHLFDTAKNPGVSTLLDATNTAIDIPPSQWHDEFADPKFLANNKLVSPDVGNILLAAPQDFSTHPTTFTYTFTADQLKTLNSFVANGNNIALGFDPDCHFYNNGVTFTVTTSAVPEPSAIFLLGGGVVGLYFRQRALRRRQAALA